MKYETAVPVGRGGIAEVLRAYDPELQRDVALKLLHRDEPQLAERMLREAQAQARVEHPNVCPVYETGTTDDGQLYIAMQFIDGVTLDEAALEMRLEEKVRILREVALAVQAAHAAGLVHRDLKPGNILIERQDDGSWKPWVVDFGLARQRDAPGMTMTGQVMGTPAYMPPEQARGENEQVDRRCDVYALGAVLYHLLTGRPPFLGQSTVDVLVKILQDDPVPVRKRSPYVPADLETITMKCLEKEPERRYPSARALAEDLERFLDGEPIEARRLSWAKRLVRRARKQKAVTSLVALIVVAVPAGTVKYTLDLRSERARALESKRQAEDLMDFMLEDLFGRLEALGRVELLGEVARKSLDHYAEDTGGEAGAEASWRRARALRNVGMVLDAEGDLEGSARSFERSREILSGLHGADGQDLRYLVDLSMTTRALGEIQQEQGLIDEALASYQEALAFARQVTARDPSYAAGQKEVWHGESNLGWLLLERGELDEALHRFQAGLAHIRRLIERFPGDGSLQYKLSSSLAYVALAQQDRGDLEAAVTSFREALRVAEALAATASDNTLWQIEVALNHSRLAYVHQERSDLAAAEERYRDALAIIEPLVAQDPGNVRWLRELAVSHSGLSAVLRRQERLAPARLEMAKSLEISRRLSSLDPSNASLRNDLAWDLVQIGMVGAALGDAAAARAAWEEALGIITPTAEATDVPYYRDTQVMALLNLGRVEEARPIVDRLLEAGWDDPEFLELCRRYGLLGS